MFVFGSIFVLCLVVCHMTREKSTALRVYNRKYFDYLNVALFVLVYNLFYMASTGLIDTDIPDHIRFALAGEGYSLFNLVLLTLNPLLGNPEVITAFILAVCIISSVYLTKMLLLKFEKVRNIEQRYLVDFVALALNLLGHIISFSYVTKGRIYLGSITPNVWHNSTYTLCKPFSLLTVYFFWQIYTLQRKESLEKVPMSQYIYLTLFAVLSMWAKPSFLAMFLPACVIFLGVECLQTKFQSFFNSFKIGCCFVPSMVVLLIQNSIIYVGDENSKVVISLGEVWGARSYNIPYSICLSFAFPLFVYAVSKNRDALSKLCLLCGVVGVAIYYVFAEEGPRLLHGNFAWSNFFGAMMFFLGAIHLCFINKYHKLQQYLMGFLFSAHLFSGLFFIQYIFYNWTYF